MPVISHRYLRNLFIRYGFKESMEVIVLSTILVVLLILVLLGALPTWPYSTGWGYGPGGIVGLILVIVIILALLGRI